MELLETYGSVDRVAHPSRTAARHETDVEHSYFLTMLAWYLVDSLALPLNKHKILEYGLVHDLVEAYAGDTYILDEEARKTKHEREEKARVRMADEFPEFSDLHANILAYESQKDSESRFIKVLDKFIPVLMNYVQGGITWKEMGVSMTWLVEHKREKIGSLSPIVDLFEDLIVEIEKEPMKYFPKK